MTNGLKSLESEPSENFEMRMVLIQEWPKNLLYFIIKDHPFADGCKRIGASLFLEFLNKNNHLIIDGKQIISNSALVAITLMIAESRPEEKETMVRLVMNFLRWL